MIYVKEQSCAISHFSMDVRTDGFFAGWYKRKTRFSFFNNNLRERGVYPLSLFVFHHIDAAYISAAHVAICIYEVC